MTRYLLSAILIGNMAIGMDDPEKDRSMKLERLIQLVVDIWAEPLWSEQKKMAEQIVNLRKELGKPNLYEDLPPLCQPTEPLILEAGELDKIIEQLPAESPVAAQSSVPLQEAHQPAEIPIEQMNQAQVEALIKKNSGMMYPPGSDYLKALGARCRELKMWPYNKNVENPAPAQVELASAVVAELPDFDQIPHMNKAQLLSFQEQLKAQEGKINVYIQSQIDERLELLTTIERENVELSAPEAAVAARALSPKKVHFDLPDSDGSGIARSSKTVKAEVDKPLNPEEFKPAESSSSLSDSDVPDLSDSKELTKFTDANSRVITTGEGYPARELIKSDELPAPFNKENFEDLLAPDEDFKGSQGAQPALERKVGKDASPTPVPPIAIARPDTSSPAPEAKDAPLAEESSSSLPDTPRGVAAAANIKDDERLAAEITAKLAKESRQTPGGPAAPTLPIAKSESTELIAQDTAEPGDRKITPTEGETPGGPDAEDDSEQDPKQWSTLQKTALAVAIVTAVYAGTEMAFAYKSIPEQEWKEAPGFKNKIALIFGKTIENVGKRPSQLRDLIMQIPAGTSTLFEKLKAKTARAA